MLPTLCAVYWVDITGLVLRRIVLRASQCTYLVRYLRENVRWKRIVELSRGV